MTSHWGAIPTHWGVPKWDTARLPTDRTWLPTAPTRLPTDNWCLPMNPMRLPIDQTRLPMNILRLPTGILR